MQETEDARSYNQIMDLAMRSTEEVQNFPMLMYLFSLKIKHKLYYWRNWKTIYKPVCLENNEIAMFSLWTQS